ncbi:MAG: diguanylate cyclase [Planctomycetes bacterium]|nr:diguanylate cyclase [Planctomycetota bacterium]
MSHDGGAVVNTDLVEGVQVATPEKASRSECWVVYMSPERKVLWSEEELWLNLAAVPMVRSEEQPEGDSVIIKVAQENYVGEAVFSTRMPMRGEHRIQDGGVTTVFQIAAYPDFALDGTFKGVVQMIGVGEKPGCSAAPADLFMDISLCGIVLYDPETRKIMKANRRISQLTGIPLVELLGADGERLFGEAGEKLLHGLGGRMFKNRNDMLWGQTLTIQLGNGGEKRFYCAIQSISNHFPDSDKKLLSISIDAPMPSSQSRPGRTLMAMDTARDGFWELDIKSRRFYYSKAFEPIFGECGEKGYPISDWEKRLHPDEIDHISRCWTSLMDKGDFYRLEYRVRDQNGDWRWIFCTIQAVLNSPDGQPVRVVGLHTDITDAVQTERNLIDAEERLRMIFENAGIGMAVANRRGELIQVNPAFLQASRYEFSELKGRKMSEFAHPDDREEVRSILTRLQKGVRREVLHEVRLISKTGEVQWMDITATQSQRDGSGEYYYIVMIEDITESRRARLKLQYEATHDYLTGVWSRYVLTERLNQHINLAVRHKQPMSFCICDLDKFKNVNDTYGHQCGDEVLIKFAKTLALACRDTDVVGRYGGEEFGVVFPNTDIKGAEMALERARIRLAEMKFPSRKGEEFSVTATFGLTGVNLDSSMRSVIAEADDALYQGKSSGRNRVVVFKPEAGALPWL